jgi:hypothetical protein
MSRRAAALALATLVLLVVFLLLGRTAADADLWGHLTFGRDILASGQIRQHDTYSFTSDLPWINHEWLAEVAMAAAWGLGGVRGLVALKIALAWVAGWCLVAAWRERVLSPQWRDGLMFAGALGVWPLLATIRPQAFSVALFAALILALVNVRRGSRRALLALPALMAVWVNVHGGWLVGAGAVGAFAIAAWVDPAFTRRQRVEIAAATVAAAAACLLNPYGTAMLGFLAHTVRPGRADVIEWQPVTALPPVAMALWLVPAAIAAAGFWRDRSTRVPWVVLAVAGLAVGSLRVVRLVGFFAVAAIMLTGPGAAGAGRHTGPGRARPDRAFGLASIAAALLAWVVVGGRISMDVPWTPEPAAARFVTAHQLHGRLLTWFDYGEYAIWHFAPALQVSMDGRRETVYSEAVRDAHQRIYHDAPDALALVDAMAPDYIWLPAVAPVVPRLEAAGWRARFRGPRSILLGRGAGPAVVDLAPVPDGRAFPGP